MTDREYTEATEALMTMLPDTEADVLTQMDRQVIRRQAVEQFRRVLDISEPAIELLRALTDEVLACGSDPLHTRAIALEADELLRMVDR